MKNTKGKEKEIKKNTKKIKVYVPLVYTTGKKCNPIKLYIDTNFFRNSDQAISLEKYIIGKTIVFEENEFSPNENKPLNVNKLGIVCFKELYSLIRYYSRALYFDNVVLEATVSKKLIFDENTSGYKTNKLTDIKFLSIEDVKERLKKEISMLLKNVKGKDSGDARHAEDIESQAVIRCFDVFHSINTFFSMDINNSKGVFYSEKVFDSELINKAKNIVNSKTIESSACIYESDVVSMSTYVIGSVAVRDSDGVVQSKGVYNSKAVKKSNAISNSKFIKSSIAVHNSMFIVKCKSIQNSLFCYKESGEFLIFNTKVKSNRFYQIKNYIERLLRYDFSNYGGGYSMDDGNILYNFNKEFFHLTANSCMDYAYTDDIYPKYVNYEYVCRSFNRVIDYVRSIPEYDVDIFKYVMRG